MELWGFWFSQQIQWASSEIWRSNSVLWSLCFCIKCRLKSPRCPNHFHSPQMIDCEFALISNCASMSKIKIVLLFAWILLSVLFAMKFGAIPDLVGLDKVEVPFIVIPWAMILAFGIYRLKKKITSTTRAWAAAFLSSSGWGLDNDETPPTHNNRSCAGGVWRVAAVVYSSRSETSYRSVTAHVLDSLINFVQERFESLNWTWSLIIQLPERSFLVRGNNLLLPSHYKRVFLARGSISA